MSESMQLFRESTHRVRMNAEYSQKQMRLLAESLSHLNMYNRGDLPFAYSTYDGSGDQRKLMESGHYVRVKDRAGNLLGVELSEDVGIPMAIMHVRMGHCPANLAMDPRNTIDPITGKQLIGGGDDEKEQVCPAMTRTCETYSYSLGKRAPKFAPAAKPKQAEAEPQVVTPRQQTELRLCGLSEAEVTLLIDKNAKQQVDIDKLRKLVGKLRVSHSLVGEFRKRIVELIEQVDTFEVSEGKLVGDLEKAEEELQEAKREVVVAKRAVADETKKVDEHKQRLIRQGQLQADIRKKAEDDIAAVKTQHEKLRKEDKYVDFLMLQAADKLVVGCEKELKAKEQELVLITREAYAMDSRLQTILREFPTIELSKESRINTAMAEYINLRGAADLEELARKHCVTLRELKASAAELTASGQPAAKPVRKRKLADLVV